MKTSNVHRVSAAQKIANKPAAPTNLPRFVLMLGKNSSCHQIALGLTYLYQKQLLHQSLARASVAFTTAGLLSPNHGSRYKIYGADSSRAGFIRASARSVRRDRGRRFALYKPSADKNDDG